MIGKIYSTTTPFYNRNTRKNEFKKRPVLVISGPRNNDYTVLPISTITKRENLDLEYDIEIIPEEYPMLNLNKECYVRTHKQTTFHRANFTKLIGDMKTNYSDLYISILEKVEEFNNKIMDDALS